MLLVQEKKQGKRNYSLATDLILSYGFNELKLHKIYLNVLSTNKRAIGFYKNVDLYMRELFKSIYILMINIMI